MTGAVLLMADISGYTQFVRTHADTADHARQSIVGLLKAIISASSTPLQVAELEGDAVFLYALAEEREFPGAAEAIKSQIPGLFRAFQGARDAMVDRADCPCEACTHIADLRLKQVVHTGEVAVERIGRFEKLFGLDVIVVHRMLKNSVEAKEYLMISEAAHESLGAFGGVTAEVRRECLEGIGEMRMHVYYSEDLSALPLAPSLNGGRRLSPSRFLRWLSAGLRVPKPPVG